MRLQAFAVRANMLPLPRVRRVILIMSLVPLIPALSMSLESNDRHWGLILRGYQDSRIYTYVSSRVIRAYSYFSHCETLVSQKKPTGWSIHASENKFGACSADQLGSGSGGFARERRRRQHHTARTMC